MIKIAIRDSEGKASIFMVGPEFATTHEEAIALAREEFPDAVVVLSSVGVSHG